MISSGTMKEKSLDDCRDWSRPECSNQATWNWTCTCAFVSSELSGYIGNVSTVNFVSK